MCAQGQYIYRPDLIHSVTTRTQKPEEHKSQTDRKVRTCHTHLIIHEITKCTAILSNIDSEAFHEKFSWEGKVPVMTHSLADGCKI